MPTPEPPTTRPVLVPDTHDEESPAAPAIPSFASLRAPRGRSAIDLLVPGADPVPSAPAPATVPAAGPRAAVGPAPAAGSRPAAEPRPAAGPRPAEYADLLRFGVRMARFVAGVPLRAAGWAVREPVHCLRRLLGG